VSLHIEWDEAKTLASDSASWRKAAAPMCLGAWEEQSLGLAYEKQHRLMQILYTPTTDKACFKSLMKHVNVG